MWAGKEVAMNHFLTLTGHSLKRRGWGEGESGESQTKTQHNPFTISYILDYLTVFF